MGNLISSQHKFSMSRQQQHSVTTTVVENIEESHEIIKGNNNTEVGRDVNNVTNEKEEDTRLSVTIAMKFPRNDCLEPNVQRQLLFNGIISLYGIQFLHRLW
jgi:hypothetical protein